MSNENNNVNKDTANSLSKYSDFANKGTNAILDSANQINKWYSEQLNKITENEIDTNRLETNVDNSIDEDNQNEISTKIETKVEEYSEIQTDNTTKENIIDKSSKIKTQTENDDVTVPIQGKSKNNGKSVAINKKKIHQRVSTAIKGVKIVNNATNKIIRTGKSINTGLNEGGLKSFENTSSKIMTKPVRKATDKVINKATNTIGKASKKFIKKNGKKIVKKTTDTVTKIMKLLAKLIADVMKLIISMLPSIAPVIIIIIVIACFCSFFGLGMSEDTKKQYEEYMINTQNEYDKTTLEFFNQGKIVDGAIDGKGMINWKAPLSIIQMLNGDLKFDDAEKELLNSFKDANLYERITEVSYTYEKETEETDNDGNKTVKKETVTETKKVIYISSLDDYINWCNNNFDKINKYKKKKKLSYDSKQTKFTNDEVEQIKLLYNSKNFFDLFGSSFKEKYAYLSVDIGDEQLQAIYNEFLKNAGKRYVMDHSNLSHDSCMDYYDCSSWVIHCLAHSGIAIIPNTTASGIYESYCNPINEGDRQAGDLVFLKDTYNTGVPGGISHIGIYMGELTINGETSEWIIDTGGNPTGVKITKYKNGWWNGSHFYGFGRLKQ